MYTNNMAAAIVDVIVAQSILHVFNALSLTTHHWPQKNSIVFVKVTAYRFFPVTYIRSPKCHWSGRACRCGAVSLAFMHSSKHAFLDSADSLHKSTATQLVAVDNYATCGQHCSVRFIAS